MKKMLLGLMLWCMMSLTAFAQDDFGIDYGFSPGLEPATRPPSVYIGLTGGYGRIFHSEGISNSLSNQNFESARSNSYFVGLNAEYILGNPKDSESSILLKALYSNLLTAQSTFIESESAILPDGQKVILKTENTASFKTSFINTEILYSRNYLFGTIFSLTGGFGIAFPLSSFLEKRKEIIEPESMILNSDDIRYRSEQNGKSLVYHETDIAKINYYVKIGIHTNLYFFGSRIAFLTPSISYNLGLNKATSTESFKINSLQFGLDFMRSL